MSLINFPILYVPDPTKGRPLFAGQIYVGQPDLDPTIVINQKQLNIIEEDGTIVPVAQPFTLSAGGVPTYNGSPVRLDVDGNYSIKILSKLGAQIYYIENAFSLLYSDLSQPYVFDTVALFKASTIEFPDGKTIHLNDRNADFTKITGTGTANTFNIIASTSVNQSIDLILSGITDVTAFGADITIDSLGAIQAAFDSDTGHIHFTKLTSSYLISDRIDIKSNKTVSWDDGAFVKLTQDSSIGHVFGTAAGETVENITFMNPQIDGGELGHVAGNNFGENGLGIARATNVRSIGGHIKGCRRGTSDFGGKGVQVEDDCDGVFIGGGLVIESCSKGFNSQGLATAFARNTIFDDIIVRNCWEIFQLDQFFSPPVYSAEQQNVSIDNIRAYNCGKKDYASAVDTGAIVINRYSHASIGTVVLVNDAAYGSIPAFVVDHQGNNIIMNDGQFFGDVTTLLDHRANATFGTGGSWENNEFNIQHRGLVTTLQRTDAAGTIAGLISHIGTDDVDAGTLLQLGAITGKIDCYARYTNLVNGNFIEGSCLSVQDSGLNLAVTETQNFVNAGGRFGQFQFTRATQDRINNQRDSDVQLQRNGSTKVQFTSNSVIVFMPTYADDTAAGAGGLVSAEFYKTSTGEVRVKV